ncbi:hypothetical protein DAI22_04g185000 [Oryza sativa Japonica Group]|nr:hypothetical protein DAI22_04g185000 [Oryza sativa Japonica Group]
MFISVEGYFGNFAFAQYSSSFLPIPHHLLILFAASIALIHQTERAAAPPLHQSPSAPPVPLPRRPSTGAPKSPRRPPPLPSTLVIKVRRRQTTRPLALHCPSPVPSLSPAGHLADPRRDSR